MKKQIAGILIVIVLGSFSYTTLFQKGFFYSHDDIQVRRIQETSREFKNKIFPIRWISGLSFGYGYPLLNFQSPLPYYLGAAVRITKVDSVTSAKILIISSFILASITMFLLGNELFGFFGGILASLLFTYAPFHSVEIYVRGNLPEFMAMNFFPLLFYSLIKIVKVGKKRYIIFSAVSIAFIILSHQLMPILIAPVLALLYVCFCRLYKAKQSQLNKINLSVILGLGLSAFFWIPLFVESGLIRAPVIETLLFQTYKNYFLPLKELISHPWGYEGFSLTSQGSMSFEIGKLHLLLLLFSLIIIFNKKYKKYSGLLKVFLLSFIFTIFMVTPYSKIIWEKVPFLIYAQLPWRFLSVTAFLVSLLASSAVLLFKSNKSKIIFSAIVIVALFLLEGYKFRPREMVANYVPSNFDIYDTTSWEYQYLPVWIQRPMEKLAIPKIEVLTSKVEIKNVNPLGTNYSFDANAEGFSNIRFNTYYFPGWNAYVDGKQITIDFFNPSDIITFQIPPGNHKIKIKFEDTPVRKISNILSLFSFLAIIWIAFKKSIYEEVY